MFRNVPAILEQCQFINNDLSNEKATKDGETLIISLLRYKALPSNSLDYIAFILKFSRICVKHDGHLVGYHFADRKDRESISRTGLRPCIDGSIGSGLYLFLGDFRGNDDVYEVDYTGPYLDCVYVDDGLSGLDDILIPSRYMNRIRSITLLKQRGTYLGTGY